MRIELCENLEWWSACGPLDFDEDDDRLREFVSAYADELAEHGFDVVPARGERSRCHGWNGANVFAFKSVGVGSFEHMDSADERRVYEAYEAAYAAAFPDDK